MRATKLLNNVTILGGQAVSVTRYETQDVGTIWLNVKSVYPGTYQSGVQLKVFLHVGGGVADTEPQFTHVFAFAVNDTKRETVKVTIPKGVSITINLKNQDAENSVTGVDLWLILG